LENLLIDDVMRRYPLPGDEARLKSKLRSALAGLDRKIVVLDDDPTGVQTVHNISVYTEWSEEAIQSGFLESSPMFFILTNSRSLTAGDTAGLHRDIAINLLKVASRLDKKFIIISRSDSTLRGHYPLETEVLRKTIEDNSSIRIDGEIIMPFFREGGRFTINNIHYVQEGKYLIPAGKTEFARDKTFGYTHSHLGKWIEEKSSGRYNAEKVKYMPLEKLRNGQIDEIAETLLAMSDFEKLVVNSLDYYDVEAFTLALLRALRQGRNFIARSAAALPKVLGGVPDRELLSESELIREKTGTGGLIIAGSHVKRTTEQLEELKKCGFIKFIEFNQHLVLEPEKLNNEVNRVVAEVEKLLSSGKTVAVYTRRDRFDLGARDREKELLVSVRISEAITDIVRKLKVRPKYIIAKGGITSSDIGTKGLGVRKAVVAGQIKPGIPVWITGKESKFPGMPYIIFPGNVGTKDTLREVAEIMA